MIKKLIFLILFCLFAWGLVGANADSIKCKTGRIVSTGDTRMEVLSKCGNPDDIEYEKHGNVPIKYFYDLGPQNFIQIITFSDGKVTGFEETGSYGTSK